MFFKDFLSLELIENPPFALVFSDSDHLLRVQIVPNLSPATYTAHGWHVANIVANMEELARRGVQFLRFDQLPQDDLGVWTSPDGHKIAWLNDPSGNVLSLTQLVEN